MLAKYQNSEISIFFPGICFILVQTNLIEFLQISPACLPWKFQNENFDGKTVTASGWGSRFYGAGITPVLQKVENLPVYGPSRCSPFYRGSSITITNNMLCAYDPPKDTCQVHLPLHISLS